MTIDEAIDLFAKLKLTKREETIARRVVKEIVERLTFLMDVGLDYLTLSRASATLVGRRGAAHPAGQSDRQLPRRGALRAGRALDRTAPARQPPSDRHARATARPRELGHRGGARRRDDPPGRLHHRHRSRRRGVRRPRGARRHLQGAPREPRVSHRPVPVGREVHSDPRHATNRRRQEADHQGRAREQPPERHRRAAARRVRRHHRRLRFGQVHADQRHPARLAGAPDQPRQDRRRWNTTPSPAWPTSTRWSRSTSSPSVARRARTRRRTPASSTRSASSSPTPRRPRSAATSRGASPST